MECVLCRRRAMMYCESDQASLCCDCDEKVHGANFLVAKHPRSLLCYACQSPTPWTASGPKLTPTVSVCAGCVRSHRRKCDRGTDQESQGCNEVDDNGGYGVSESEGNSREDEEEEEDGEDEHEDGENQVVPWSQASSRLPAANSSSEGYSSGGGGAEKTSKRKRVNRDGSDSDDEDTHDESSSPTSRSPIRHRPTTDPDLLPTNQDFKDHPKLRSADIMKSIKRLQTTMATDCNEASRKTIIGVRNFRRDHRH